MSVAEAIEAWRDFYGAVANATAALLGLVFVGMSLHLTLRRTPTPMPARHDASALRWRPCRRLLWCSFTRTHAARSAAWRWCSSGTDRALDDPTLFRGFGVSWRGDVRPERLTDLSADEPWRVDCADI